MSLFKDRSEDPFPRVWDCELSRFMVGYVFNGGFLFCGGLDFCLLLKIDFENLPVQRTKLFSSPDENTPDFIFGSSGLYSTSAPFLTLLSISVFMYCTQWSASSCGLLYGSCLDGFSACRHQWVMRVLLFKSCFSISVILGSFILPSLSFCIPLHFVGRNCV